MTEPTQDITLAQATILLSRYGFEMKGYISQELIEKWLKDYSAKWIRIAIIEALYQGRYKAISVEQILKLWQRRKQMTCHFTHEFERLICRNLPESVDSCLDSFREMSHDSKKSQRQINRKPFNPPVTNQPNTDQSNQDNLNREQPISHQLKTFNEKMWGTEPVLDSALTHENHQPSNPSVEQPLKDNDFNPVNQLPTHKEEESLSSSENKKDNNEDLKASLTNLDELFTHFFTDTESHKSSQSAYYSDEDHAHQWRGLIPGRTIEEFTPQLDRSELYSKLKAVVRQE